MATLAEQRKHGSRLDEITRIEGEIVRHAAYAHQVHNIATWILIGALISSLFPLYWVLEPDPQIQVGTALLRNVDGSDFAHATPGNPFRVARHFCIDQSLSGIMRRELIGPHAEVYHIETMPILSEEGCRISTWTVTIPATIPAGMYQYRVRLDYELNPLRRARKTLPLVPMEVR